ncbi:MAG: AIPR family protein [Ignavibacteriae bacterium]|nr:AIPR family protein [Ignavibacteriota bacterium]
MDRITSSLLNEFVKENGIEKLSEETAFEHFTGFLVTSKHYTESFSSDDIHVGAGGDCGIDSISILVNGCLVTEPEEINDLAETNGYIDATFIFNQAERSSNFETQKIGQISFGVTDFLSTKPSLPQNEMIKKKSKIINEIISKSSKFKKGNPQCFLYYTTTGKWTGDTNLTARKTALVKDIQDLNLFRKVDFEFIDSEKIQILFRETKNALSTEINFPDRTVIPELKGVEQAYLGLLSSTEYLKLIQNSDEEVITSIFYDNVRHWQEWNPVNKEIKSTLENENQKYYFPLLNNGITIIAKRILPTGNKFIIEDYQIVNGCQTSYVLHECKENLAKEIFIPVRFIATNNPEIKNLITKATNRQTEISEEQLFASTEFPKKLEAYFPTFEGFKKLFYERRSRQYSSEEGIEKVRVINITTLVRAYASFFLGFPHRTTRNYKALLKSIGNEIFNKEHRLEMYYVSAYAHYKLEYLYRSGIISATLKPARYHLLYLFRLLTKNSPLPRPNSHEMGKACEDFMNKLWNDQYVKDTFVKASEIVIKVADGNLHSDNIRTEPFTEKVCKEV